MSAKAALLHTASWRYVYVDGSFCAYELWKSLHSTIAREGAKDKLGKLSGVVLSGVWGCALAVRVRLSKKEWEE